MRIDGVYYGMNKLISVRTHRAAFGEGTPTPGLAVAGEIEVTLYVNAGTGTIPRKAEIIPYVRVCNETQQSEWIQKGLYYVDSRQSTPDRYTTLHGYDAMLTTERTQPWSELSWPALDIDEVSEIATIMGVTVDPRTTVLMTAGFRIPMPAQYTMRETLAQIAALYGGSFVMTDTNTLLLVCVWNLKTTADAVLRNNFFQLDPVRAFPAVTGIRFLLEDDSEVFAGTTTGYVFEIRCPWATSAMAATLLTKMQGYVYRSYTASDAVIDPALELGDTLMIITQKSGLFSEDVSFGTLHTATIGAGGDEELDHDYKFESPEERRYTRRMENMESELTVQAQQISAKVSRVGGSASSFGWYLDADRFSLMSNNVEVMQVNQNGLTVRGTVYADAGEIGGCSIVNGVLSVQNANIDSINASKITAGTLNVGRIAAKSLTGAKIADETLASGKLADGAAVNRVIGNSAVSYAKTSFQGTLDQVGTNKANIDTIFGYFTGSANFSALNAANFWLNGYRINAGTTTPYGNLVTWSNS
ncbi:MAG: hypothetical protein IJQ02_11865 [Oscillospiraceae bacterium]|nr:hypothetical protein [Oscillospiraceae bacterium]